MKLGIVIGSVMIAVMGWAGPLKSRESAVVRGAYIVELAEEPLIPALNRAAGVKGKGLAFHDKKLVAAHRARIAGEQAALRPGLQLLGAKVNGSVDVVMNAMFVRYAGTASELRAMPGVKQVYQVHRMKLSLDRIVNNLQVSDVWKSVGGQANAGAGFAIGILDTGIDMSHPAFVDTGFQTPNGFPAADSDADRQLLNNKVIAGRSYAALIDPNEPDPTIQDHFGHGTALAMVAAGATNQCVPTDAAPCPFTAAITGVAPGAYLGIYRIYDTNLNTSDEAMISAVNDAVADGMDVLSIATNSYPLFNRRFDQDPYYVAMENAYQAGVIVVCSADNDGPDYTSVNSPATEPHVIATGAASNDRAFGPAVWGEIPYIQATNLTANFDDGATSNTPVTGTIIDASLLNNNIYGCDAYASSRSLQGGIVFVAQGPAGAECSFETKLKNAQNAGAAGAIVYGYQADADACLPNPGYDCLPSPNTVGSATLPAQLMDYYTASQLLYLADQSPANLTLGFTTIFSIPGNLLTSFSSTGPSVDLSIKPDVVSVGENVAMATQTLDPNSSWYDPSGYIVANGTSFASPFVAALTVILKSARPGLTVDQYRSLVINSAGAMTNQLGKPYSTQQVGAGLVNALSAYQSPLAASPVSIGLGTFSSGTVSSDQVVTVTNVGGNADTFAFSAASNDGILNPGFSPGSVTLGPGESSDVTVHFKATKLGAGAYEGYVVATAASSGAKIQIPYWLDVPSGPAHIFVTCNPPTFCAGDSVRGSEILDAFDFRITDSAGAPVLNVKPTVTVVSGGGSVKAVNSADGADTTVNVGSGANPVYTSDVPGLWTVDVVLGSKTGQNTYRVKVGSLSMDFMINGCTQATLDTQGHC